MSVYTEVGLQQGLYRGLSTNYVRVVPQVAVMFCVYEFTKQLMSTLDPVDCQGSRVGDVGRCGDSQVPWHASVPALEWNHIRKDERALALLKRTSSCGTILGNTREPQLLYICTFSVQSASNCGAISRSMREPLMV